MSNAVGTRIVEPGISAPRHPLCVPMKSLVTQLACVSMIRCEDHSGSCCRAFHHSCCVFGVDKIVTSICPMLDTHSLAYQI